MRMGVCLLSSGKVEEEGRRTVEGFDRTGEARRVIVERDAERFSGGCRRGFYHAQMVIILERVSL